MGRRIKAYRMNKKYLFIGIAIAVVSLGVVFLTSLALTSCRNPLMDVIESSGITVKADGKAIQPGGEYDLGRVKQGGSYEATFTITNSGNKDLELTGSPDLVRIEGGAAGMFSVLQEPTNMIKVRNDSSFILSYNPIGEGPTDIQLRIDNNSKTDDFAFDLTSYVDGTAPTVDLKYPQGTAVPTNVVVSATFSEAMDADSVNETTFTLTGFVAGAVSATVSYNASTFTAYLNPDSNLNADEYYTATLSTAEITDLAGNSLFDAGGGAWIFETGASADVDPPQVNSTVPLDGADEVLLDAVVSATFDEDIDPSTISTSTFKLLKGAAEVSGAVSYSVATKTANFTPDSDLDPSTVYTARLTAGIEDTTGNATTSAYEWSFTTETGVDNTPPEVLSKNPLSGASGVATNTIISALFNEPIDPTTMTASTFTLTEFGVGAVSGTVAYDTNSMTATFTPTSPSPLTASKAFTATLTAGIADMAGNNLSQVSWSFVTGGGTDSTAPTVSSTSPADAATGVLVGADITAEFDEAMDATTINDATFKLLDGVVELAGTVSYNELTFEATFDPTDSLDETTGYTARITTSAKDAAGNALDSQYEWSFTTEAGSTSPEVISVTPINGAVDIDASTTIIVEFSKMMDDTTITTGTFTVSVLGGSAVAGSVSYNATTREATFTPSSALSDEETYKVECTTGMEDIGGNPLTSFSSIFTTAAGNKWDSMIWSKGKWAP